MPSAIQPNLSEPILAEMGTAEENRGEKYMLVWYFGAPGRFPKSLFLMWIPHSCQKTGRYMRKTGNH